MSTTDRLRRPVLILATALDPRRVHRRDVDRAGPTPAAPAKPTASAKPATVTQTPEEAYDPTRCVARGRTPGRRPPSRDPLEHRGGDGRLPHGRAGQGLGQHRGHRSPTIRSPGSRTSGPSAASRPGATASRSRGRGACRPSASIPSRSGSPPTARRSSSSRPETPRPRHDQSVRHRGAHARCRSHASSSSRAPSNTTPSRPTARSCTSSSTCRVRPRATTRSGRSRRRPARSAPRSSSTRPTSTRRWPAGRSPRRVGPTAWCSPSTAARSTRSSTPSTASECVGDLPRPARDRRRRRGRRARLGHGRQARR